MNSTEVDYSGVYTSDSFSGDFVPWDAAAVIQIMILVIITVFGTFGNILVIIAICRDRKLRIPGNYFLINLSAADLIITAFSIPVILSNFISERLQRNEVPVDVNKFCETTAYLKVLGLHVSWYSLAFIALNRYFSLCRMQDYATYFTKKRVLSTIGLTWIFVLLINFPIMAGWAVPSGEKLQENSTRGYYYAYERGRPPVIYDKSSRDCVLGVRNHGGYTYANGFFVMALPLISIIFCYSLVYMEIVRCRRRMQKTMAVKQLRKRYKKERKISLMLAIVVVVFILCWAPVIIYDYAHTIDNDAELDVARLFFSWIALSNSAMNPGLYAMLSGPFRNAYKQLLIILISKIWCWKLSPRTNNQELSSASMSRNDSLTTSRRIPKLIPCRRKSREIKSKATVSRVRSFDEIELDKDTFVLELKTSPSTNQRSANPAVIKAQIEGCAQKSFEIGNGPKRSLSTTRAPNELRDEHIVSRSGEQFPIKTVSSSVPSNTDSSTPKKFKSILDQVDDSLAMYTEGGIYLGGAVMKEDLRIESSSDGDEYLRIESSSDGDEDLRIESSSDGDEDLRIESSSDANNNDS